MNKNISPDPFFDPLNFSHAYKAGDITKTACDLDVTSSLDMQEKPFNVTCTNCVANIEGAKRAEVLTQDAEVYPADSEPEQTAEQQPDPDQQIHWACGIGLPACLATDAQSMTNEKSKVTCIKCREMIVAIDAMKKPSGDGLNIVFVNIPADTVSNVFANLLSGISVG
jgi:hypothetical protein